MTIVEVRERRHIRLSKHSKLFLIQGASLASTFRVAGRATVQRLYCRGKAHAAELFVD